MPEEQTPKEMPLDDSPMLQLKLEQLRQARQARLDWKKIEEGLLEEIQGELRKTGAQVATLNDRPVASWKPTARFAKAKFKTELPELAEQYTEATIVYEINTKKLKETNPSVYQEYLVRQFLLEE